MHKTPARGTPVGSTALLRAFEETTRTVFPSTLLASCANWRYDRLPKTFPIYYAKTDLLTLGLHRIFALTAGDAKVSG